MRPRRWLYLPAALAAVTAVVLVALVVQGFRTGFPGNAVRVTGPGTTEITLSEPGDYTISYEHRIAGAGWSIETGGEPTSIPAELSSMRLQLVSAATGAPVALRAVGGHVTYQVGSTEGIGVAEFKIDRPGAYSLSSRYSDGRSEPSVVLAIARGSPGDVAVYVLLVFAALGLSLAAAAIWGITLFLRLRARDRARAAAMGLRRSHLRPETDARMPPAS